MCARIRWGDTATLPGRVGFMTLSFILLCTAIFIFLCCGAVIFSGVLTEKISDRLGYSKYGDQDRIAFIFILFIGLYLLILSGIAWGVL